MKPQTFWLVDEPLDLLSHSRPTCIMLADGVDRCVSKAKCGGNRKVCNGMSRTNSFVYRSCHRFPSRGFISKCPNISDSVKVFWWMCPINWCLIHNITYIYLILLFLANWQMEVKNDSLWSLFVTYNFVCLCLSELFQWTQLRFGNVMIVAASRPTQEKLKMF